MSDWAIHPVKRLRLSTLIGDDVPDQPDLVVCDGMPGTAVLLQDELPAPPDPFDDSLPEPVWSVAVTLRNVPGKVVRWVDERHDRTFLIDAWLTLPPSVGSPRGSVGRWTGWQFTARQWDCWTGTDLGSVSGVLTPDVVARFHTFRATTETMPAPTV